VKSNRHDGTTAKIRKALEQGDMTAPAISAAVGASVATVRALLGTMISRTGGVMVVPDTKPRKYARCAPGKPVRSKPTPIRRTTSEEKGPYAMAAPRDRPHFKWRFGANW
jgi:hypothetical protein